MKVHKVPQMNPKTQQKGYGTRAVLNGQESWDDLIEYAARNTSIHKAELTAAATLIIEGAVMALKNGKSVDRVGHCHCHIIVWHHARHNRYVWGIALYHW